LPPRPVFLSCRRTLREGGRKTEPESKGVSERARKRERKKKKGEGRREGGRDGDLHFGVCLP